MNRTPNLMRLAAPLFLLPAFAFAVTTRAVRDDSFKELQQGELEGVALTSDGYLIPAFERTSAGDTGSEIIWQSLDLGPGRGVLCATGHKGRLVRLKEGEEPKVVAELPRPELTALALLPDGDVLVAAAPGAWLHRLGSDDSLTTVTQLDAKFVWSMETGDDGSVWVATGDRGGLFRVEFDGAKASAELVHKFSSKNLIDLWIDREGLMGGSGAIYVGGQDPGWLYSYQPSDKSVRVLYDSESDEIRALTATPEGLALATNTDRSPTAQALALTLRISGSEVSGGSGGGEGGSSSGSLKPSAKDMGDVFESSGKKPAGGPESKLILLTPEGFARELWEAPERPIHSVAAAPDGDLLVAAGGRGRVFQTLPGDDFALVADLREDYVYHIAPTEDGWLLSCARNGVAWRMSRERAREATFTSRVIDVSHQVRWGRLYWSGETGRGQKVSVSVRKGNTGNPDKGGWGEWTAAEAVRPDEGVALPAEAARYIQYRLTLHQGRQAQPVQSNYVDLYYQGPNRRPQMKDVTVVPGGASPGGSSSSSGGGSSSSSSRGSSGGSSTGSASAAALLRQLAGVQAGGRKPDSNKKGITVSWSATDPDGDSLTYSAWYKARDEQSWKLIDDELKAPRMSLSVAGVADGRYRFKVEASDEEDNTPGLGLRASRVSDEIVIDNTPPRVEGIETEAHLSRATFRFRAVDDMSLISSVLVDLDGGDAWPLTPKDGFLDQRVEEIEWSTPRLEMGEHVLTIVVTDQEGNSSVARAVFKTGMPL